MLHLCTNISGILSAYNIKLAPHLRRPSRTARALDRKDFGPCRDGDKRESLEAGERKLNSHVRFTTEVDCAHMPNQGQESVT